MFFSWICVLYVITARHSRRALSGGLPDSAFLFPRPAAVPFCPRLVPPSLFLAASHGLQVLVQKQGRLPGSHLAVRPFPGSAGRWGALVAASFPRPPPPSCFFPPSLPRPGPRRRPECPPAPPRERLCRGLSVSNGMWRARLQKLVLMQSTPIVFEPIIRPGLLYCLYVRGCAVRKRSQYERVIRVNEFLHFCRALANRGPCVRC